MAFVSLYLRVHDLVILVGFVGAAAGTHGPCGGKDRKDLKAIRELGRYIKYAGLKELRAYPVLVSQWCLVFGVQS